MKGFSHETNSNNKNMEWYTPKSIFDSLNTWFDLDPASPKGGLPWIPASFFYSKEDDGLSKEWNGFVWCNPPYGKDTHKWLKRMSEHRNGIALVFSRTDCSWYHDYVKNADAILFIKGRIRFVDEMGKQGGSPGTGSMLVGYGKKAVKTLTKAKSLGHLVLNEE